MITEKQAWIMRRAADLVAPNEACGVIANDGTTHVLPNIAREPTANFEVAPEELVVVFTKHGGIDAVWHSHPGGTVDPSDADWDALPVGCRMIIVANGEVYDHGTARP